MFLSCRRLSCKKQVSSPGERTCHPRQILDSAAFHGADTPLAHADIATFRKLTNEDALIEAEPWRARAHETRRVSFKYASESVRSCGANSDDAKSRSTLFASRVILAPD